MTDVTVTIPEGKYCGECKLLGGVEFALLCNWDYSKFRYAPNDVNEDKPIKHPDCPGLKMERYRQQVEDCLDKGRFSLISPDGVVTPLIMERVP